MRRENSKPPEEIHEKKKIRIRQGFTIVELVIVIGVIGVLSAVLIPTFINLNNKANEAADQSLIKNLNTQLAIKRETEGKNKTMTDALADALEAGYKVENLTPKAGKDIVWNQDTDEFSQRDSLPENAHRYWLIAKSSADLTRGYASYLYFKPTDPITVTTGFDAGTYQDVNVSYIRPAGAASQVVTIRTNGGDLIIDAPTDEVNHYNSVDTVWVKHIKNASYHESGYASYLQADNGHVVVENEGGAGTIYISSDSASVVVKDDDTVDAVFAASAEAQSKVEGAAATVADVTEVEEYHEKASRFGGGIGTEEKPYLLHNNKHFDSLNEDVNAGNTDGVFYKLISDFKFDDYGMIGTVIYRSTGAQSGEVESVSPFSGTLDGNGHSIDYKYKESTYAGDAGLFASIDEGQVKNLTLNVDLTKITSGFAGGLAGEICNSQISKVTVNGTVRGYKCLGGFAGFAYSLNNSNETEFVNCVNNATLINTYSNTGAQDNYAVIGGFVGECSVYNYVDDKWGGSYDNSLSFTNCTNNGKFVYLGGGAKTIATYSNFVGFTSDSYYGNLYFNNCKVGDSVTFEGSIAAQRAVSTKTVLTGYSTANVAIAPTIKYIGISSNVWSANASKVHVYVDDALVENGVDDHIVVSA